MSKYTSLLNVNAREMTRGEYDALLQQETPIGVSADTKGYLVVVDDSVAGFAKQAKWLTQPEFETAYRRSGAMSFGQAVEALKQGERVARSGWNGKGMFLFLVRGAAVAQAINDRYGNPEEQPLEVLDAIYMKTADNKLVPWLCSQTDGLAEDWYVVG